MQWVDFSNLKIQPYFDPIAMNMMEIVNHAKSVLGDEFKFCAGNAHTASRVAAGFAFAGHKVILLGRYPHPATRPGKICLSRLRKHLEFSWLKLQIDKSVWF
nr:hypothetical protein BSM_20130 [uncultured archaeon]